MRFFRFLGRVSPRIHLALGLATLAAAVVLAAGYAGLVADGEALIRAHRGSIAETMAITASGLIDEARPERLQETLEVLRKRNPDILSIGVRAQDGRLLVDLQGHAAQWPPGPRAVSTDSEIVVPLRQADQAWGALELRFEPLRGTGWSQLLTDPRVRLGAFVFGACFLLFLAYLTGMLGALDPSRAVPQRVRAAYDTLTEGLVVVDGAGAIMLANRSICAMLGVDERRLIGRSISKFGWSRSDGSLLARELLPWEVAQKSKLAQRDTRLTVTSRGGTRYALRANCSPIVDGNGALQAQVLSFQDVTELEQRSAALQAAKESADAANQAKSQFLANMSHEIRTPMNAILGFTEVLRRGGLRNPTEATKQLDIIHSNGTHLLNLINDILDLSKVEAGRLEVEHIAFAPHQLAHAVVQTLQERAHDKGLLLSLEFGQALPATVQGDPGRVRQVLTNLIGNAIKFTDSGSVKVVLRLAPDGSRTRYCIDVQDSGIGIPPDKLESVFEPFVQAESSTTRRFGGTGLGLTISRGFARAMGGDITVDSVHGKGTTFSFWIDAGDVTGANLLDPLALAAAPVAASPPQPVHWRFPSRRVLVVDDGSENRQLMRVLLEDVGLHVSEAENGQAALDRIAVEPFDLVLMDMQMPVMDGQTATRRLRSQGSQLPVIALTANAMKGFETELAAAGFSGHLTKPIDLDELLRSLAARLDGRLVDPALYHAPDPSQRAGPPTARLAAKHQVITSRLAGHAKLGPIVDRFVQQLPARLAQMDAAAAANDRVALASLAHWLKGSGGSMGFDDLFEPAKALEEAARAGDHAATLTVLAELNEIGRRIARPAVTSAAHPEESTR